MDSFGASETGHAGTVLDLERGGPRFTMNETTNVLDDDGRPVAPGSGQVGRLARRGHIPLGYYKDEEKTAATFLVDPDGKRWVIPGDFATIDADGTLNLLGRGSVCINTGGEKVYPEEVEAALKAHPDVFDAVVVGVPDERFAERVAAIVTPRDGATVDARRAPGVLPHRSSPGTRCRASCTSPTRSRARPSASPTTAGPSACDRRGSATEERT